MNGLHVPKRLPIDCSRRGSISKDVSKDTLVVNLFGGPGAGKSTMAADIFAQLKWKGVSAELALEYAKDLVWEGRLETLENQVYVFGKQLHRIQRLVGNVDVVITDSPLLLSSIYKPDNLSSTFDALVLDVFKRFNSWNIIVDRLKPYVPKGRLQTEVEAKTKDREIERYLIKHNISYTHYFGDHSGAESVTKGIIRILEKGAIASQKT